MGTYDKAHSKWLPVFRAWVSPDGNHYAYSVNPTAAGPVTGTVHVVDVVTGADKPIVVPSTSNVVSYEADGVYIVHVVPNSGAPTAGLVKVDPVSSMWNQITAVGTWSVIGSGAAYGADLDSSIAAPANPGPGAYNRLRKLDLPSHAISTAKQFPGRSVTVLGFDAGQPLLSLQGASDYSVVRLDGTSLFSGPIAATNPTYPMVSDGGAIWFSSFGGSIWRWDATGGMRLLATTSLQSAMVAGACR